MTRNIFLSYAIQDQGKLGDVMNKLLEPELCGGNELLVVNHDTEEFEDARTEIKQSMADADAVVIVWTPASARSSWVNYEVGMADALEKPIIVVRPDKNPPALPASLKSSDVQIVDLAAPPA